MNDVFIFALHHEDAQILTAALMIGHRLLETDMWFRIQYCLVSI